MKPEVKFSVELTHINTVAAQFEDEERKILKKAGHVEIGFEIIHSNGIVQYAPTTIPITSPQMSDASIIQQAAKEILPGQIAMAYQFSLEMLEAESEKE